MVKPFNGARLKIERAKQHINDLYLRAQFFADNHPHHITVERDPDTGNDFLRIAPAKPFPDELLLILGDALHNLRSALDHAWCRMVFKPTPFTKFPVHKSREALEAAINGGLKDNSSKEVKDVLMDVIQPYLGGDGELIVHLHDLDIEDKHRILIAHRQFTLISGITLKGDGDEEFVIGDWLIVPPHTASEPFEGHSNLQITNYGQARTHVTFGEGMPMQGRFVMPTLRAMTVLVSRIVDCLEAERLRASA